ncbi:hypothetical protein B0H15DRAFT_792692 [Mycena belliarum]|uniref:Uncharacterized protein n=1 Tax=Mycena belliarum TaxID=1033014 RepID=A0AAD6TTC0_9AGAR|nr:hypothetical protein B0H15DRAFT_792692 [Mycena belliae]
MRPATPPPPPPPPEHQGLPASPPLPRPLLPTLPPSPPPHVMPALSPAPPPSPLRDVTPPPPSPPASPDAGTWFRAVYGEVSRKSLGGCYNEVLEEWARVERGYNWDMNKGGRGLSKAGRPAEVSAWVTAARGLRKGALANGVGPEIKLLSDFDMTWWSWWGNLQPGWRRKDMQTPGRFVRDTYPEDGRDTWDTLRHPGQNGVLSLVATLYWWGMKVAADGGRADQESWTEAVTDVKWMLSGLRAANMAGGG